MNIGTLFVVATPIGNLGDITFRALEVLRGVDGIICEDTRVTTKLLQHYQIQGKPLFSFTSHSSEEKISAIISQLMEGKSFALVTDAGTPAISDPGSKLVEVVLNQCGEKVKVESIPGASALTAALSVSGVPASEFLFLGFLPHKKGRQTLFQEIAAATRPVVFYESTHRLLKALESLGQFAPDKKVVVVKEITKIYESVVRGSAKEVLATFTDAPDRQKGEFVIIVY